MTELQNVQPLPTIAAQLLVVTFPVRRHYCWLELYFQLNRTINSKWAIFGLCQCCNQ